MKIRAFVRSAIAANAAALAALAALPAGAQERTTRAEGIEEIVVTSRRVEETLQDIPLSVSAFQASDLEKLNIEKVGDTASFTPNFIRNTGPTGQNDGFFFIRGVGQTDLNPSTDPGVGTYIDGVYLGRLMGSSFDSLDIQRIEVLRGPQGTLFGRNTIGGAVNVVTADPRFDAVSGQLTAGGGERSLITARGRVNVPLSDTVAVALSALYREQEGFARNLFTGDTYEDTENLAARAKLLWAPSESFSARLAGDISRVRGTPQHQILIGANFLRPSPPYPPGTPLSSPLAVPIPQAIAQDINTGDWFTNRASTEDPRHDLDVEGVNLTLEWDLGPTVLKSISSYRQLEQYATNDFDGTRFNFYQSAFTTDQDQLSQELQLTGDTGRLNWLVGAYYYDESAYHNNFISLGGNNGCLPFAPPFPFAGPPPAVCGATPYISPLVNRTVNNNQQYTIDIEAMALFAHTTFKLTDRWSASLGLRWTDEEKTQAYDFFVDNTANVANLACVPPGTPGFPPTGLCFSPIAPGITPTLSSRNPNVGVPTTYSDSWSEVTPKVGIEFQPREELLYYLSYAEGFKSGGFNGRPTPNSQGQFAAVRPYDPERIRTAELGVKSQLADNRVRLNAAAFFSRYQDIQLLVLGPSGFFETENAAEAEIYGLELELLARPIPAVELTASLGYMDHEYTELDPGAAASGILPQNRLPHTPEWNGSLGAQYTWSLANAGAFSLRGDYTYRSEVVFGASNAPLDRDGSLGLLNLRARYDFPGDRFSLAAYVRNVTDEEYFTNGQDVRDILGVAFIAVGEPRTWGAEFTYRFGP